MDEDDHDHFAVAIEHFVYWKQLGLRNAEMLHALRVRPLHWPVMAEDVVNVLAAMHRDLAWPPLIRRRV